MISFLIMVVMMTGTNVHPAASTAIQTDETPSRGEGIQVEEIPLPISLPSMDPKYVIICPDEFKEEVLPLAVHRTKMGLPSRIYTIDSIEGNYTGADREQKVHNFLRSMHETYTSFNWLFIVGDAEHLMPRALWHYAYDRGQPFHNYYFSDVYYAGLDSSWDTDGNGRYGEYSVAGEIDGDIDWDIFVGRVPASTEAHAANYVNKLIRYEKNPPVGSWMERFLNWGSLMEPPNRDFEPNKYYDHKSNAYKVGMRVEGNLPPHIELKSLYDYPELEGGNYTVGDGRDTLHRSNMLSQFNGGASMLNFVGQARYEAYALNDYGPPTGDGTSWDWNEPMRYSDHALFTNGDMMPFMYASTCDTAKFYDQGSYNDMSLETWLTSASGGIIGLISSTGTSARGEEQTRSWGNWYLDEEFWKLFLNNGETRPGKTLFALKQLYENKWLSPTMEIKETILGMIYTYILLGDPWVDIYTAPAERFMVNTAIGTNFYTGNHTTRFQVLDRDLDPVPFPRVTIYNDQIYITLTGNEEGWVNTALDLATSSRINLTLTGHNMVPAFYKYDVIPAVSDIEISPVYTIEPENYSIGDKIDIGMEVLNRGGMTAENVGIHIILNGGNGDPTGPYTSSQLGDILPGGSASAGLNWTVRPGNHSFSIFVDTTSQEIDHLNNELEIVFDNPGPQFEFGQGTGTIKPWFTTAPEAALSINYDILNLGPISGPIEVQLFQGDPLLNGTALSQVIEAGVVEAGRWMNGTIEFQAPAEDGLLYILMDPLDRYPSGFLDDPATSFIEINYPPRWTEEPSMAILEDSRNNRLRLDTIVIDDDTVTDSLDFSFIEPENLTCRIVREEDGIYLECEPKKDWYGSTQVHISVYDGLSTGVMVLNVSVIEVNDPPFFPDAVQGVIELSILEDEHFEFVLNGDDIDSEVLTFIWNGPHIIVDEMNGTVTWDPIQENVGTTDFRIKLQDDEGGETTLILRLTVFEMNDPPIVAAIQDVEVQIGEKKRIEIDAYDEEGRSLEYGSNKSLVWIDEEGTMHVNGSSQFLGVNPVKIFVSDGLNTVYLTFNVTVTGEHDGSDSSDKDERLQYILGGAGIALAVIALLFLGFTFLRRTDIDDEVTMELNQADELYEQDMQSLEEDHGFDLELEEE
jgi:hypothetical protein